MPTDTERLTAIRTQTLARMAEITAAPKPSYDIDGQQVAWTEYLRQLQQTVDWCNERLAGSAPFEFQTQAGT